jgi:hypothetical protein
MSSNEQLLEKISKLSEDINGVNSVLSNLISNSNSNSNSRDPKIKYKFNKNKLDEINNEKNNVIDNYINNFNEIIEKLKSKKNSADINEIHNEKKIQKEKETGLSYLYSFFSKTDDKTVYTFLKVENDNKNILELYNYLVEKIFNNPITQYLPYNNSLQATIYYKYVFGTIICLNICLNFINNVNMNNDTYLTTEKLNELFIDILTNKIKSIPTSQISTGIVTILSTDITKNNNFIDKIKYTFYSAKNFQLKDTGSSVNNNLEIPISFKYSMSENFSSGTKYPDCEITNEYLPKNNINQFLIIFTIDGINLDFFLEINYYYCGGIVKNDNIRKQFIITINNNEYYINPNIKSSYDNLLYLLVK